VRGKKGRGETCFEEVGVAGGVEVDVSVGRIFGLGDNQSISEDFGAQKIVRLPS